MFRQTSFGSTLPVQVSSRRSRETVKAGGQCKRVRNSADDRCQQHFAAGIGFADSLHVAEPPQRYPVVQSQKQNVKRLEHQQCCHSPEV